MPPPNDIQHFDNSLNYAPRKYLESIKFINIGLMSQQRTLKLVIELHILNTLVIYFTYRYENTKINDNVIMTFYLAFVFIRNYKKSFLHHIYMIYQDHNNRNTS